MTRKLTQYELNILKSKVINWSYSSCIINGFIELGNGIDEGTVALLPYELLMSKDIVSISDEHILPIK